MVRLVNVDSKYIRFLYKTDNRVMYNKGQKRPYIGILFEVRKHKYYAPLTHPKEKFKAMKNSEDFMRIKGGTLGAINFNNMIPVVDSAVKELNISEVIDKKYKLLLIQQIEFFDEYGPEIVNRATKLYQAYNKKKLRREVYIRCCDFRKLEKQSIKYDPNFTHNEALVKNNIKRDAV